MNAFKPILKSILHKVNNSSLGDFRKTVLNQFNLEEQKVDRPFHEERLFSLTKINKIISSATDVQQTR